MLMVAKPKLDKKMVSCIPGLKSATLFPLYGVLVGTQGGTVPQVDPGTLKEQ